MSHTRTAKAITIGVAILLVVMTVMLFACDGKKESYTVSFYVDGELYQTVNSSSGSISLPAEPTKEGYTFDGWYLEDGNVFTLASSVNTDLSLYAKWKVKEESGSDTPSDTPSTTALTITGFTLDGDVFSFEVANAVDKVDLEPIAKVDERSAYAVSSDAEGKNVVGKTITLAEGANTFYVTVTASDAATKTYTVNVYRRHLYTLTFVTGVEQTVAPVSVEEKATASAPTVTLTRTGYTFGGWDYDFTKAVTASATVTAQWTPNQYTLTFVTGTDTVVEPIVVDYGAVVAAPVVTLEKTGYTFAGWDYDFTKAVTASATVTAQWTVNQYTLTFVTGVDTAIDPIVADYGTVVTAPVVALEKTGYTFAGWDYDFTKAVTASATVTAQWTPNGYELIFVTGTDATVEPIVVDYGTVVAAPVVTLVKTGYTFAGWDYDFTQPVTASATVTAQWTPKTYTVTFANSVHDPITVTYGEDMPAISYEYFKEGYLYDGLAYNGVKYYNADFTSAKAWDVDASDVVLTEVWVAGGYVVSLNPANGSPFGQATLIYGEAYTLAVPSKTGYQFEGWYSSVSEIQMTDDEGNSLAPSEVTDSSWTFVAHWSPISVDIIFDANGGTFNDGLSTDTASIEYDSDTFMFPVPVKDGCTFLGWYVGDVAYTNASALAIRKWDLLEETTLIAKYDEVDYVITFDMQGGAPQQVALTANYHGAWPTITTIPTKTGYTFVGYYSENDVLVYTVQEGEMVCKVDYFYFTHNTELSAQWNAINVKAIFDHQGGESDLQWKNVIYDQSMGTIAADLPTKDGYIFAGYFSAKEGGVKYYNADGTAAKNCDFVADTTLYAQWRNGVYFVKFVANAEDSFGVMEDQEIEMNVSTALHLYDFGVSGYSFASWNTKADGTGTSYADGASVSNLANNGESVTLYAQWTANTYTVTFSAGYGTGTQASVTATYDAAMPTIEVSVSRTGYIFEGYYYGDYKYYNADGTSAKTWRLAYDLELSARWTAKQWTVHFDANGGSEIEQTATATYDHNAPNFGYVPLRTGYDFLGWYTAAEGGVQYINTSGYGAAKWELDVEGEDATLYAHWTGQVYDVQFSSNNGSNTMNSIKATYGSDMPAVTIPFTRTGYTLTGLWDSESGGTKYYNVDGTSAHVWDKTNNWIYLYAQWEANTYTVSFDAGDGTGEQASIQATYNEYPEDIVVTVSRSYYRFTGYYDSTNNQWFDADGKAVYRWTKSADTTLYAHWSSGQYRIIYHTNYGEDSTNTDTYNNNTNYNLYSGYTRTGYTFKEWNTKADGTGNGFNAYASINNFADNGETVELYAIFTANSYRTYVRTYYNEWDVTFDLNYEDPAIEAPAAQHVTPATGLRYVVPAEREGYVFAGWYKEPACTNQFYFYDSVTQNTTVYAKWVETEAPLVLVEDGEYDITITADNQYFSFYCYQTGYVYFTVGKDAFVHVGSDHYGPTFSQYCYANTLYECYYHQKSDADEYRGDTTIVITRYWPSQDGRAKADTYLDDLTYDADLPLGALTAEGYEFGGWFSSSDGTGTQYVDAEGNSVTPFNYNYSYGDIYAYWIPNVYTLTLNKNGGEGGADSVEVNFGTYPTIKKEDLPTREDYDFTGYYSAAEGGSCYVGNTGSGNKTWITAAAGTLYAHWTKSTYRVKYDGNGADSGEMSDAIFSRNTDNNLNFYNFVKAGYTCTGWNTAADGSGTAYSRTATVNNLAAAHGEITLYAQWTPNTYKVTPITNKTTSHTITFDLNGYDGETPEPQVVTVAEGAKLPQVERDGYELIGWYTDAECTGAPYAVNTVQTEDVTLYAKWRVATYEGTEELLVLGSAVNVTFKGTEHKDNPASGVYYAFIAPSDMKVSFFSESNMDTVGYLRASDKSAIAYNDDGGTGNNFLISYTLTGGTLYYVVVLPYSSGSTATVMLHVEATEGEKHPATKLEDVEVTYDAAFSIPVPSLIGHYFLGWYDGFGGTGTQYTGADGVSIVAWDKTANASLYAYWQIGTFAVAFDANDGTGTQASVEATYGSAMPAVTVGVSRANYTFLGYFDAAEGGTKYYNADGTSARTWDKNAATLYAHWQGLPYTVAFDANGGEGSMSNETLYYATAGNLTANAYTKTGYDFASWNTKADGTGTDYTDEAEVTDLTTVGEAITLYAKWTPKEYEITLVKRNSYTVSFDCGGKCDNPPAQVVTSSVGLTYPMVKADGGGWVCLGWQKNGSWFDFSSEITADITLTAYWESASYTPAIPFTVNNITIPYGYPGYFKIAAPVSGTYTFTLSKPADIGTSGNKTVYSKYIYAHNSDTFWVQAIHDDDAEKGAATLTITCDTPLPGGSKASPATTESTTTVTYGAATTIAAHASAGYTFMGWFDEADGAGTKYVNADGTSAKAWDKTAEDVVLYAYYVANEYTVTLNLDGGSGSVTSVTATHNSAMPTVSESLPTKSGYDFLGFFAAAEGGVMYYDAEGNSAHVFDQTAATTLYAHWEKYWYTVAFDGNGGSGEMANQRITRDVATKLTEYDFSRNGYRFDGWNTESDGSGTGYSDKESVTNIAAAKTTITLYAQWTPRVYHVYRVYNVQSTYTVTFDVNGADCDAPEAQTVGVTHGLCLPQPIWAGHELVGWYDNAACTGEPISTTTAYSSDMTLYAKWRTAEYDGSDTLLTLGTPYALTFNGTVYRAEPGYYFAFVAPSNMRVKIYSTKVEGNVDTMAWLFPAASKDVADKLMSDDDGNGDGQFAIYYNVTAGTLYYIGVGDYYGREGVCNICIDAVEGSYWKESMESMNVTYDASFDLDTPPAKVGYTFKGWYTEPDGEGTQLTGVTGDSIANWAFAEDVTVYAKWEED